MGITFQFGGGDPRTDYQSVVVDRDIGQPDAAELALSGVNHDVEIGATVEIKFGDDLIYSGEVVDIADVHGGSEPAHTRVRAMNKFHRLNLGRRSHVFLESKKGQGVKEEDVFKGILQLMAKTKEVELSLDWGEKNPEIVHPEAVLWTNQTPMEFLCMRAERYGYHVWCVGETLHCKVPALSKESNFELSRRNSGSTEGKKVLSVMSFEPRMSSARIVKKVTVRSSNPISGKVIEDNSDVGGPRSSPLGKEHAVQVCGRAETEIVDLPISSKPEAKAVADADFLRRSLTFITAEAVVDLNPKLELGKTVGVSVSPGDDRFNGRYLVVGMTHHHTLVNNNQDSYRTLLRLARDSQFARKEG